MIKIAKNLLTIISLLLVLTAPYFVFASNVVSNNLNSVGIQSGFEKVDENSAASLAGNILGVILSLLGILFIGYFLYGGYVWMLASGNEDMIRKAKSTIRNAIIGVVVTASVYGIYLLIKAILTY